MSLPAWVSLTNVLAPPAPAALDCRNPAVPRLLVPRGGLRCDRRGPPMIQSRVLAVGLPHLDLELPLTLVVEGRVDEEGHDGLPFNTADRRPNLA